MIKQISITSERPTVRAQSGQHVSNEAVVRDLRQLALCAASSSAKFRGYNTCPVDRFNGRMAAVSEKRGKSSIPQTDFCAKILDVRTKLPIPEPQGTAPMERLDWGFRTVLKVPKAELVKNEERVRHPRAGRKDRSRP